jgi:hypothetical protein
VARPNVKNEEAVRILRNAAERTRPRTLPQSGVVAGERAALIPSASPNADESGRLSPIAWLLLLSFAAAGVLFSLAAVPRAWTIRYGFVGRLADVRGGLRLVAIVLIVESVVIALMLRT